MKTFLLVLLIIALVFVILVFSGVIDLNRNAELAEPSTSAAAQAATPAPSTTQTPTPSPVSSPEPRADADFRNARWGDDMQTVLQYESSDSIVVNEYGFSVNDTDVGGYSAAAVFYFDENYGLYQGGYLLTEYNYSIGTYIIQYNSLKEKITLLYGSPFEDTIENLSYLADYASADQALQMGYVRYRTQWTTGRTKILLAMSAHDYNDIVTLISYNAADFEAPENTNGL